eukprot:5614641-Pleurochrysis_carterae.AAC.1
MDLAHEEKYAGHPILRLFTRPEEMENGTYMRVAKEDVTHMNAASGKKLTYDTLNLPRMGQKKGEQKLGESHKVVRDHIRSVARTGIGRDPR